MSFEYGCQMFLWICKVGLGSLSLGLVRGEKNWNCFCLKSWTRNTQSGLVSKIGKNDQFLILFVFEFLLIFFCLDLIYMMLFSSLNHSLLFASITQVHSCIHI